MNELLQFLTSRNSSPKLMEPGPTPEQLEDIISAGLRAPDHARLRPWRFLSVSGERRQDLGRLFRQALIERNPDADETARAKAENAPLRAPLVLVVVCRLSEHPKVPHVEQRLSAGCAAHGILLGAEALGYAGIWRTGDVTFDRAFMNALGLGSNEEISGFLYLGTRDGEPKPLPSLQAADYCRSW